MKCYLRIAYDGRVEGVKVRHQSLNVCIVAMMHVLPKRKQNVYYEGQQVAVKGFSTFTTPTSVRSWLTHWIELTTTTPKIEESI